MVQMKHCQPVERRLQGVPLSPGVAMGHACFYVQRCEEPASDAATAPQVEIQRLRNALRWLARQRSVLAREAAIRLGEQHAEIFEAHRLMLTDEYFQSQLARAVETQGYCAEEAVENTLNRYKQQLSGADSDYLQQRVADIGEIQQALLSYLRRIVACRRCHGSVGCDIRHCRLGSDHILIGEEISASLPIETDEHTLGFVVDKAGPTSHAVILARALRCPVVGNIRNLPTTLPPESTVLIDGTRGEMILNPSNVTLAYYRASLRRGRRGLQTSAPVASLKVMANIGRSGDVGDALAAGAEGVGLYRTEMELLAEGRLLSEDEQASRYSEVVTAMAGRPVHIRLLDLGCDKGAEWLGTTLPGIPQAGERGARLLLAHPELLRVQARALARASSDGPIHVLYPMISSIDQFVELHRLFDAAVSHIRPVGLQHGVLFEVPSACLSAPQIMQVADFGCIGTNDLIQYLFGAHRSCGGTGDGNSFDTDTVLWELIEQLSRAAAQAGKPMTICGEVAGNPALTCRIMDAGISAISTSPALIAEVRRAARASCTTPPDVAS